MSYLFVIVLSNLFCSNLGCSLFKLKEYTGAVKYLKRALSRDPSNVSVIENLGQAYLALNEYEMASECAEQVRDRKSVV